MAERVAETADTEAQPASATPRSRAKADRRDALLTAAAELFARRGFDGVSIDIFPLVLLFGVPVRYS